MVGKTISEITRRDFVKLSIGTGFGLMASIYLEGCGVNQPVITSTPTALAPTLPSPEIPSTNNSFNANAYVQMDPEGKVTVTVHRSEMGQGIRTALAMAVAEELEVNWEDVRAIQAPADHVNGIYGPQITGGSESISNSFNIYRQAGATVRTALIAAAARAWEVERETCRAVSSTVVHEPSGSVLTYAQLVGLVSKLDVPQKAPLKDPSNFHLVGTRVKRIEGPEIVTGQTVYGLDVVVPDMTFAVVERCPVFDGSVSSFNEGAARAVAGVLNIVNLGYGVAVVAENSWAALKGREALSVIWNEGPNASLTQSEIHDALLAQAEANPASVEGISDVVQSVQAIYEAPYLAHMTMEPQNSVAAIYGNKVEVWSPTQDPQHAASEISRALNIPAQNVTLHVTGIGGGFGRRLEVDYAVEAATIASAVGAPVKIMWTREDDIQHDFYRPVSMHSLSGGLDASGMPIAWQHHIVSYGRDEEARTAGARTQYDIGQANARSILKQFPVPSGDWRSVFNSQNAFAVECFFDELAETGEKDPFELRRSLLSGRGRAVLEMVAEKAGWGTPLPDGMGRGIAYWSTWSRAHVAEVAEVSVANDGTFRVHRVVCVVDCGLPVNLDGIEAQAEGGILFALAALTQEITIDKGRVQQSNFHDFPHLRLRDTPQLEVSIIPSDQPPGGMGEMTGPPLTAAVLNAIYAVTGKRIRRLPIKPEDLI